MRQLAIAFLKKISRFQNSNEVRFVWRRLPKGEKYFNRFLALFSGTVFMYRVLVLYQGLDLPCEEKWNSLAYMTV